MMDYVPPEQRDSRWHIWNDLFMVRVPFLQNQSVDYLQHFGVPASGYAPYDQQTANELVTRMMSIKEMVEFFARGVTIAVVKHSDTKVIYERITDHLQAWKRELETSLHIRNAPLDDLRTMDRFASAVYPHAQQHFTEEIVESLIARRMSSVMRVRRDNILGPPPEAVRRIRGEADAEPQEEPTKPQRVSMAEVFASRQIAGKAKWK